MPTEDQDIKTLIWFSNGFYSISETDEKEAFIFKDLRYPLMDEEDSNSSVFSFLIKKENNNWMLQPIHMDQPKEKDFEDFWNRLKGI